MKPKRLACLLLTGVWACSPKLIVTRMALPPGQSQMAAIPGDDAGGMYYALPLSIVTVDVPVTKIERTKGGCFDENDNFCKKLMEEQLGKKWKSDLVDHWTLEKDTYTFYKLHDKEITMGTRPAPDRDKVYYATLKGQWNRNQQLAITLNELGQMTKGEFVNENRTFDLIVQGVSSIAGIVSAVSPLRDAITGNEAPATNQVDSFRTVDICQQKKENLLIVRNARFDQIKNAQNTGDGTIFKRKLEELDALEAKLIAGLTFEEQKTKAILHFDILVPTPATSSPADIAAALSKISLFAFDKEGGIEILTTPAPGSYQNEYLVQFGRQATTPSSGYKVYYLTFDYTPGVQFADRTYTSAGSSAAVPGIAYNVPVMVRGRIQAITGTTPEASVAVGMLPMPQLGKVAHLPERASKVGFELDPLTGALRIISLQQTGLSVDQVKAAGEAISTGASAVRKASKTELEQIQSDNSLLEQQIKKIKQQKTLDSLSGSSKVSQ